MKILVLVGDGMGDYPVESLGNKTPLQAAHIPNMRRLAAAGEVRMVQTIPEGMAPGSDVANLDLLGYNPAGNYTGRAPIEAAGAGIPLAAADVAYRCNLVTVEDEHMRDYSAGHISTGEAHQLIDAVAAELGSETLRFHGGVSYRHLLIWENGPTALTTEPPHEISDKAIAPHLPTGTGQEDVRRLMEASREILRDHPVNKARIAAGKNPATQIWLWGQGRALALETYQALYGLKGGVITAVDLVRGLGILAGLDVPRVPGVTGFIDTNYEGKVEAAKALLADGDFAYVHVEAPDECGHMGDAKLKTGAIEAFDEKVVGPLWCHLEGLGEPYRLLVCMDHRTPVSLKGHTSEPVPLTRVDGPVGRVNEEAPFDEFLNGGKAQCMAHDWIRELLASRE
jgi:2,3-bisphosphoglycerate-independent phosphoglycerate mutase